ncbi:MAG: PAS domain-containing protein, partial [Myxococcales bacterium]|nr:PAS domain-containing protein [Myxococcales bacterium]
MSAPTRTSPLRSIARSAAPITDLDVGTWLASSRACGLLVADPAGQVTWANAAARELLGVDELLGRSLCELSPEGAALLQRLGEADGRVAEFTVSGDDGVHRAVEAQVERGEAGLLLQVRDPTENHALQEELLRLASFPEFNPFPVMELGLDDGRIRYANQSSAGLEPAVERAVAALSEKLADDGVHPIEILHEGRTFTGSAHAIPDFGCVRVYLRDDTARVQLFRAIAEHRDELEGRVADRTAALAREVEVRKVAEQRALEASGAKSMFLANMSHE